MGGENVSLNDVICVINRYDGIKVERSCCNFKCLLILCL